MCTSPRLRIAIIPTLLYVCLTTYSPQHTMRAQHARVVPVVISISNNHGGGATLRAGLHDFGSDSLDSWAGEMELPPVPPAELFDARFVSPSPSVYLGEGSLTDYRATRNASATFSKEYRIRFQAGIEAQRVSLRFPSSYSTAITRIRVDGRSVNPGDSIVTTSSSGSLTLTMEFNLSDITFTLSQSTIQFSLSNRSTKLPSAVRVTVTPSIGAATWYASASDTWITLDRTIGRGTQDILIGLAYMNFPAGQTTGTITIRDTPNGRGTTLPITVDMVVGIANPEEQLAFSIDHVFPHPAQTGADVQVDFTLEAGSTVSCRVWDMRGRVRRTVVDGRSFAPGHARLVWDARDEAGQVVEAGTYAISLESRDRRVMKLIVIR